MSRSPVARAIRTGLLLFLLALCAHVSTAAEPSLPLDLLASGDEWRISVSQNPDAADQAQESRLLVSSSGKQIYAASSWSFHLLESPPIELDTSGTTAILVQGFSGGAHCCATLYVFGRQGRTLFFAGKIYQGERDVGPELLKLPASHETRLVADDTAFDGWDINRHTSLGAPLVFRFDGHSLVVDPVAMRRSVSTVLRDGCRMSGTRALDGTITDASELAHTANGAPPLTIHEAAENILAEDSSGAERSIHAAQLAVCLYYAGEPQASRDLITGTAGSSSEAVRINTRIAEGVATSAYAAQIRAVSGIPGR